MNGDPSYDLDLPELRKHLESARDARVDMRVGVGLALALLDRLEAADTALVELKPAEVLVEGFYIPVDDLPGALGRTMRARDEYARDAKADHTRAEAAEESRRLADEMIRATLEAMGSGPETDPVVKAGELRKRAEAAEAAVQRARELHRPMPVYDDECGDMECEREHVEINEDLYHADQIAYEACEQCTDNTGEAFPEHVHYPCATRRALDGEAGQ